MPTEVITTLIPGGGGDYTTLSGWESGEGRDLVSLDEIAVVECHSGAINNNVGISGWITNATHYAEIRPAAGHEHGGDPTAGFRVTNAAANTIRCGESARVKGIVVLPTANKAGVTHTAEAGTTVHIAGNIINGGGTSTGDGILSDTSGTVHVYNNIIYGFAGASNGRGICANHASTTINAYNNTVVDVRTGIAQVAGTLRPKNNIVQGSLVADYSGTLSDSATNISSDTTSPQSGLRSIDIDFVDAANDDYHLAATDTEAIGAGTDLSADATLAFDYDIDGDTRPQGAAWDIGADERLAAATGGLRSPLLLLGVGA